MKHLIAFIVTFVFILNTLADEDKCDKYKSEGYDIEGNTTCPAILLTSIHAYFQNCVKGSNHTIKYNRTSHLSKVAMYWAGQRKLTLKYGEKRYAQLGMGAWRKTAIYSRFLNLTTAIVGKTMQPFPQYAASPYTQFLPDEWNQTKEMGIGCWAQQAFKGKGKNKVRGIAVWVWLFFDLPENFKKRIESSKNGTTLAPTTTSKTTTLEPTTTTTKKP